MSRRSRPWRHRRRSRLRARLARSFALVAVLAVFLSSWLTVSAVFRVLGQFILADSQAPAPGSQLESWWAQLDPLARQAWINVGHVASREILRSAFPAVVLSALVAVTVASLVTRQLTLPLGRLAEGARRLERGERGLRLPTPKVDDELRDLTVAFNAFVDSVERQEAWRRALVADVAHDLRTPLAVLRAEIEAMQDGVNPPDERGLNRLHGEVLLLARLVDDLRTLSLAEGGALSLHRERLDAGPFVRDTVDSYASRAAALGVSVSAQAPVGLWTEADPDRLAQVLHNLIDNALRHAPGSPVEVGVCRAGGAVEIRVRDHGPGLSQEALERVFERFYRADPSRTRDLSGQASSGLGLTIARALVQAHGGDLSARNTPEGGAVFVARLPAA